MSRLLPPEERRPPDGHGEALSRLAVSFSVVECKFVVVSANFSVVAASSALTPKRPTTWTAMK